ncbi:MAG: citrate synthase/methylcitrate synthase, partial [Proteobacteria bacterium]|nr:citrate synthase/methylcitrate synthase [Pseudomonadota bacterium]
MASRAIEPLADGLEGVIVAETMLSRVDGARGRLVVRGHDVESLAGRIPFEGVCSLLWTGELEKEPAQLGSPLRSRLGRARQRAFAALSHLGDALGNPDGMEALRTAVAHLRIDPETEADEQAERVAITGAVAVFVAAWARRQLANAEPVAPDPSLSHAADTLRMIAGAAAGQAEVAALDAYLTTVAEHGMNASTFTARVVASTGSDTVSAVVAAVGALKGPLHGGVPGPVLEMLDSIATPEAARAWLEAELAAGRRIMGMGHRVYRVRDPRAAVFEQAVERLAAAGVASQRLALARAVEREARALLRARYPDRPLEANVEFYTAVLLDA